MNKLFKLFPHSEVKYFVNKDKKIVVAIVKFGVDEFMGYYGVDNIIQDNKHSYIQGKGIAICNSVDTFDIDKGKYIARAKAEQQVYLKVRDRLDKFINYANYTRDLYANYAKKQSEYIRQF